MRTLVLSLPLLLARGGSPAEPATASGPASTEPPPAEGSPTLDWAGGLTEQEFIALHELTDREAPPPRGEDIELAGTHAYLSLPPDAQAPVPGVVVIHEWWGLNEHIRHWADRLAAEGYAALAVDLYGGRVATEPDRAMELMQAVDDERALAILHAAHTFLEMDSRIEARRTAVVGWCFGGKWALRAAIAIDELDAAVMYYGHVVEDREQLRQIDASLLGIFGNRDTSITPAKVDAFEQALATAEVDHRILRYDADHAFANPSGARYDREAAEDAWTHVERFLEEHLAAP